MQATLNGLTGNERAQLTRYGSGKTEDSRGLKIEVSGRAAISPNSIRRMFTLAGESYCELESQYLVNLIDEQNHNVVSKCCHAIGHIQLNTAISRLIQTRLWKLNSPEIRTLVLIGIPIIVENFADRIKKAANTQHLSFLSELRSDRLRRWTVPLMISLLDDYWLRNNHPIKILEKESCLTPAIRTIPCCISFWEKHLSKVTINTCFPPS